MLIANFVRYLDFLQMKLQKVIDVCKFCNKNYKMDFPSIKWIAFVIENEIQKIKGNAETKTGKIKVVKVATSE